MSIPNVTWHHSSVERLRREEISGGAGATVWFTGLSGSGKSTIAVALEEVLLEQGRLCYRLDGDNVRHGLNANLGFSPEDRTENIRRLGEVARLMADAGLVVLVAAISPYRADRDRVRSRHLNASLGFTKVFVDTPLEVCERRDPKGLYERARSGELRGMTGIDAPYEAHLEPELHLKTTSTSVAEAVEALLAIL